jgi:hypothetical protein
MQHILVTTIASLTSPLKATLILLSKIQNEFRLSLISVSGKVYIFKWDYSFWCKYRKIIWNACLMQQGNFINVFLARHVSGVHAHHLESRCVGRVCGADGTIRTAHTTSAAALKTTTHPKTRCRKPYGATQHLMLLMMSVYTRNMSS